MARPSRRRSAWCAAAALTGVVALTSCLAVPPPTLSEEGPVRPTIVYAGSSPPPGLPMDEWPDGGIFVIQVESQNQPFYYDAFIDYDPYSSSNAAPAYPPMMTPGANPDPVTVEVPLKQPDLRFCHTVEILVAHQFNQNAHVPESVGGDIATWFFTPVGGNCAMIDAGPYATGAFFDAGSP